MKIPCEYWLKWKEKFFSLFVSGKMIVFYSITFLSTYLLINSHISDDVWFKIMTAAIAVITMRGVVEFAEIKYNRKLENILDCAVYEEKNGKSSQSS